MTDGLIPTFFYTNTFYSNFSWSHPHFLVVSAWRRKKWMNYCCWYGCAEAGARFSTVAPWRVLLPVLARRRHRRLSAGPLPPHNCAAAIASIPAANVDLLEYSQEHKQALLHHRRVYQWWRFTIFLFKNILKENFKEVFRLALCWRLNIASGRTS